MFGKSRRQIKHVTFVQPLKGEAYFYTPIAYSTDFQNSKQKKGNRVFTDSDLALAGKLKLIFEREKMTWFEIREEKSKPLSKDERLFVLYYYPQRLVASRASSSDEKATLWEIRKLFDFIVTKDQIRFAEVPHTTSPSAYGSLVGKSREELEVTPVVAIESRKDSEAIPVVVVP